MLHPVAADDPQLPAALAAALRGGRPVAVLPAEAAARERFLAVLAPEVPVGADVGVVVATSGSTGEPKAVVLPVSALQASVAATAARLGGPGSWTLTLPASSVAGLMVLVRAVVGGGALRRLSSDLSDPALAPEGDGPHFLSVVPTQLHRVADDPAAVERLARYDTVLVGGAAAEDGLLERFRAGGVRLVTTYGMSETCGGCVYDGRPLDGVQVSVDPADQRITLTTPTAFAGYHRRPELTREVLTGPGRVRTADRGRLDGGRLTVLGRVDDVVVSGGTNVDLARVERLVRAALGSEQVAVTARPDAEWGARVVLVLTADGPAPTLADVRELLRPRVEPAALPTEVLRLPTLPLLPGGKLDRLSLRRAAADVPATTDPTTSATTTGPALPEGPR
ncbi:AMP-binding protein [Auraticoccus sp. F435]|uniref:AMP-binding protein n=1 Tax=Auraticoccus cholistanensis TaxID=2656650 RepID=A0A6A9UUU3_9ACTN|nr:AMP-binding protein [Auraticoccus cholistanensis]